MKATLPAAIAAQLNATMLGRCVLAHAGGFDESGCDPDQWPDRLQACMAQVFEGLAAEITVIRQNQPDLTAEVFARLLLAEANYLEEQASELEDDDEPEEDNPCPWLNDPSLTAEERNSTYR